MNESIDLDGLTRRTQRLEYEDGLRDFQLGTIFLILGLVNWFIFTPAGLELFIKAVASYRDLIIPAVGGSFGLIILLLVGGERVMERIRRAAFWKESGFVKPLRFGLVSKGVMILTGILVLAVIIGSVWLMARGTINQEMALRSIPAAAGLGSAITFIGVGIKLKLRRYLIVGVAGALISFPVLLAEMSLGSAYLYTGIGWAIILALSGGWALGWALRDVKERALHG